MARRLDPTGAALAVRQARPFRTLAVAALLGLLAAGAAVLIRAPEPPRVPQPAGGMTEALAYRLLELGYEPDASAGAGSLVSGETALRRECAGHCVSWVLDRRGESRVSVPVGRGWRGEEEARTALCSAWQEAAWFVRPDVRLLIRAAIRNDEGAAGQHFEYAGGWTYRLVRRPPGQEVVRGVLGRTIVRATPSRIELVFQPCEHPPLPGPPPTGAAPTGAAPAQP